MAELYKGKWVDSRPAAEEIGEDGRFNRAESRFRDTISSEPGADYPAEAGRYHLWIAYVCPWAGRTLAVRALKGLQDLIPVHVAQAGLPKEGWTFDAGPGPDGFFGREPEGYPLHRLYTRHDPLASGKVSVPVLWDSKTGRIVNNESSEIIRNLNTAFDHLTGNRLDLYPEALRPEIDRWNDLIYPTLNNGVYRAGFAATQAAYDEAVAGIFATLDAMDAHLASNRYLAGEYCTEADWRAFTTLVRFDVGYHGAFKCNRKRIEDYPALRGYLRELYQWPGIAETVRLDEVRAGYYQLADKFGIVGVGPDLDLTTPHGRDALPGKGIWERGE